MPGVKGADEIILRCPFAADSDVSTVMSRIRLSD
jgi:hypothetical protein